MFLLVLAPMMGVVYTYWIFLSTITYALAIIKAYYKEGYFPKWMYFAFVISQFIFVIDVIGIITLEIIIIIKSKKEKEKEKEN